MRNDNESSPGVIEHLEELRKRILIVLAGWIVLSVAGYLLSKDILQLLLQPLARYQEKPVFTRPVEPFSSILRIAFFTGGFLNLPNLLYQAWAFLLPAMTAKEKRAVGFTLCAFPLLFAAGAAFSLYVIVPFGLRVLFSFAGDSMKPLISIGSYLSFLLVFMGALGLVFNLPVILGGFASAGIVNSGFLISKRRYAILCCFVIAALLTPPDVFTQILVAIPLIILYEISIILAKIFNK